MNWRVTKAATPATVWGRYADAIGIEALKKIFGAHWPPPDARPLEEVYVWRDADANPRPFDSKDHPAAWLSLTRHQFYSWQAMMSRGVWPEYLDRHLGLGRRMRVFAEEWCRSNDVLDLTIEVFPANSQHLVNVLNDPYWKLTTVNIDPVSFKFSHEIG
jgi:hypothetical protein